MNNFLTNNLNELLTDYYNNDHSHTTKEGYLSISQISNIECDRRLYYLIRGDQYENNVIPDNVMVLQIGTLIHEFIQKLLTKNNHITGCEEFLFDKTHKICGSTDGYIYDKKSKTIIVLDFKTTNLNNFKQIYKNNQPKEEHINQVHLYAYMLAKKHKAIIKGLKILYINKNNSVFDKENLFTTSNIKSVYLYLQNIRTWLVNKNKDTTSIDVQLNKLEYSLNRLTYEYDNTMFIELDFNYYESKTEYILNKLHELRTLLKDNKKNKTNILPSKTTKKSMCKYCNYNKICFQKT